MSSGFTPVNQVRLTNVAYVRLQKKGKRFEIACYRNKVVSWRNKIETNLDEVLQVKTVFINVSKGMLASSNDLMEAFGTSDQNLVCQEILDKGEMQVSEQERGALLESIFRDVASIVVDKSINPENNRPYTISMIQNAMRQIHFSANISKSSKSQALEVIRKLKTVMPIARASMHLRIVCPSSDVLEVKDKLLKELGVIPCAEDDTNINAESSILEVKVDPEYYRKIEEMITNITISKGRVEVIHMRVLNTQQTVGVPTPIQNKEVSTSDDMKTASKSKKSKNKQQQQPQQKESSRIVDKITKGNILKPIQEEDMDVDIHHHPSKMIKGTRRNHQHTTTTTLIVEDSDSNDELQDGCSDEENKKERIQPVRYLDHDDDHDDDDEYDVDEGDDDEEDIDPTDILLQQLSLDQQQKKNFKEQLISQQQYVMQEGNDEDVEITALGMAKKTSKQKKKNKDKKSQHISAESPEDTELIEPSEQAEASSFSTTVQISSNTTTDIPKKSNKKGKTTKRIEKQENIELELRMIKIKERIDESSSKLHSKTSTTSTIISPISTITPETSGTGALPLISSTLVPMGGHINSSNNSNSNSSNSISSASSAKSCNTCGGHFPDATAYRNHFRSEWHRYNLNRKLKNLPIIPSEEEFSKVTLKELEANSISSS